TFSVTGTLATGTTTSSVAITDIDRDGFPDVLASSLGDGTVYVFPGKGTMSFQAPYVTTVGGGPLGVAAGDLSSDGKADVAVVLSTSNQTAVLLNDSGFPCPNESFSAPRSFPAAARPYFLAKGDFNGDGHEDVVMSHDLSGTPDAVTVFTSGGAGLTL